MGEMWRRLPGCDSLVRSSVLDLRHAAHALAADQLRCSVGRCATSNKWKNCFAAIPLQIYF